MPRKLTLTTIQVELPVDFHKSSAIHPAYRAALKSCLMSEPSSFTGVWPFPEIPRENETINLGEMMKKAHVQAVSYRWQQKKREIVISATWQDEHISLFDILRSASLSLGIDFSPPLVKIFRAAGLPTTIPSYSKKWPQGPR